MTAKNPWCTVTARSPRQIKHCGLPSAAAARAFALSGMDSRNKPVAPPSELLIY